MSPRSRKIIVQEKMMEVSAGKATPAPPIGPALGGLVGNVGAVCKEMNDKTKHIAPGTVVRFLVRAYSDKSYDLEVGLSPTSWIIKNELGIEKGSATAGREVISSVDMDFVEKVAGIKLQEMTAGNLDSAKRSVIGSLKSMGIAVK
ncbi:MAG: ribosomal L11p family protein [Chlamydiia bacterium]|nr:ribosomal L11p family protein [Chlamydiia bacterium]